MEKFEGKDAKKRLGDKNGSGDRKRIAITLEDKLDVIKLLERNERICDISRITGIKESTLRTIRENADRIKANCVAGVRLTSSRCSRHRAKEMEEMEKQLNAWIKDEMEKRSGITHTSTRMKALAIYKELEKKSKNPADVPTFSASSGWFNRFKNRYGLNGIKLGGEPANNDDRATETFPRLLEKVVQEGGYTLDQIFNFKEAALYWKRLPSRTYIAIREAEDPTCKAGKDRLTVLLGSNASGDLKLKPVVVYHSENPSALKGFLKSTLGVYFRSSKKGQMTGSIFSDLLLEVFEDVFQRYCERKNADFKILLLLETAPCYPQTVAELSPNIKVVFLPPNTSSQLQPMDQGITAAFNAYYLRCLLVKLMAVAEGGVESVMGFWNSFNVKNGIDAVVEAWDDITRECLSTCWKKVIPVEYGNDNPGFDPSEELTAVKEACVDLANLAGFKEVDGDDVEEFLDAQGDDGTDVEGVVDEDETQDGKPRELSTVVLADALREIQKQLRVLQDNDYNAERSRMVIRGVNSVLAPYEWLLQERRRTETQQKSTNLKTVSQGKSFSSEPMPSTSAANLSNPNLLPTDAEDDDNVKPLDL